MENRCVMCGTIIPEGLLVCPICTKKALTEERRKKDYEYQLETQANLSEILGRCG